MNVKLRILDYIIIHLLIIVIQLFVGIKFNIPLSLLKINIIIIFIWNVFCFHKCGGKIFHPYILFMIAFFVFLLGRIFLDILGHSDFAQTLWFTTYIFGLKVQIEILNLILLSLLFMQLGALIAIYLASFKKNINISSSWAYNYPLKKIGLLMFIIAVIPYSLSILQQVLFVISNGYVALYSNKNLIVQNPILRLSDDIYTMGIFLFFACYPTKKEIKIPMIIYIILLGFTLLIGRRGTVFTEILSLIAYLGFRNEIKIKHFVITGLFLVILSFVMNLYRSNESLSTYKLAPKKIIENFLFEQGGTSQIIGYTLEQKKNIKGSWEYLLDPITFTLKNSLPGFKKPTRGQSLEVVKERYSLSNEIAFRTNPAVYLHGNGIGTSSISEFYISGGYLGLAIMSFLYVFVIVYFIENYKFTVVGMFLLFFILPQFFFSPRAHPFDFVPFIIRPLFLLLILQYLFPLGRGKTIATSLN
ncbi:MAG TPA: O-antigen polysaccharide polymerase Wzy [Ignavibacteria bacterium]